MATENEDVEGAEGEEGAPKPKSRKGLIIGIVALLVLGGGGAGAYFAFSGGPDAKGGKEAKAKVEQKEKLPPKYIALDPPFVFALEESHSFHSTGLLTIKLNACNTASLARQA